jgi:hypothetical protein
VEFPHIRLLSDAEPSYSYTDPRHDSLQEISAQFKMKKYSSVSSIIERMKVRIEADKKIKKRIVELCNIIKSQEQT